MIANLAHTPLPIHSSIFVSTKCPASILNWKRRRLKLIRRRSAGLTMTMSIPIEKLFHGIISVFPSVNSLELIVPALGFVAGTALYLSSSRRRRRKEVEEEIVENWILFSRPTLFNRSVLLRCPSLLFEDGGEFLDGVNERLMEEEMHLVNFNRGKMVANGEDEWVEDEIQYQRVCVRTDDGGVIAIDWPDNLMLEKEYGLDATLLLVPGTTEGSSSRAVRSFASQALRYGYFPIVMNPRGCAGSPVITPRLFTAADSDDIDVAVRFIKGSRPWTTLMCVGWGYGSNMLTKYLSEVGDETSVTASICIDNPFDLDKFTRSYLYHDVFQKFTYEMVGILQANKEMFQGKNKGFDVSKAISATSLREFDNAISMISHGFKDIREFYSKSSTSQLVSNVRIPVLFIQIDEMIGPVLSIPCNLIAENPFTSLLMRSSLSSIVYGTKRSGIIMGQYVAIEWLQAVELALMKGRHPLLEDVDIPLNPSYDFPSPSIRKILPQITKIKKGSIAAIDKSENGNYTSELPRSIYPKKYSNYAFNQMVEQSNSGQRASELEYSLMGEMNTNTSSAKDTSLNVRENSDGLSSDNNSDALTTAAMVLNMLDATVPGNLNDERKQKVLVAVSQGETLIKALQEAVPEEVRVKLVTAASHIVESQHSILSLDGLIKLGCIPNVKPKKKSKTDEELTETSINEVDSSHDLQDSVTVDEMQTHSSLFVQSSINSTAREGETSQVNASHNSEASEVERDLMKIDSSREVHNFNEIIAEEDKSIQSHEGDGVHKDDQIVAELSNCYGIKEVSESDESTMISSGDSSSVKEETKELRKKTEGGQSEFEQKVTLDSPSSAPSLSAINVSEALDAFKSFDDSTQMAVNSVFGVIENMIDQLEKKTDQNVEEGKREEHLKAEHDITDKDLKIENKSRDKNIEAHSKSKEEGPQKATEDSHTDKIGDEKTETLTYPLNLKSEDTKLSYNLRNVLNTYAVVCDEHLSANRKGSAANCQDNCETRYTDAMRDENAWSCSHQLLQKTDWDSSYRAYLHRYYLSQLSHMQSADAQSVTDLFLDTKNGQWKISDQSENDKCALQENKRHVDANGNCQKLNSLLVTADQNILFNPSYPVPYKEAKLEGQSKVELNTVSSYANKEDYVNVINQKLLWLIKNTIQEILKVEVRRNLGILEIDINPELLYDIDSVANVVSFSIVQHSDLLLSLDTKGLQDSNIIFPFKDEVATMKFGTIHGQVLVGTISSAVQDTSHLRGILPTGVIVGSSLASLSKYFDISDVSDNRLDGTIFSGDMLEKIDRQGADMKDKCSIGKEPVDVSGYDERNRDHNNIDSHNTDMIVRSLRALMCASALLAYYGYYQKDGCQKNHGRTIHDLSDEVKGHKAKNKAEMEPQDIDQDNLAKNIAEKAMSVAAPVVPTKNDGELDEERLVNILTELGQKGGLLKFLGNIALLWGGIRGAMSLTDRLIRVLRIAERPLLHRILGFVCMTLLIWSPVAIPLLPKIVQSWTDKNSAGIALHACVAGFHVAILILIMLWGKRIRGYDYPLKRYGLSLSSTSRLREFLKGIIGGTLLVLAVHLTNASLGYAFFTRPPKFISYSGHAAVVVKEYGKLILFFTRGILLATSVATTEELLFRSWLPDEISADLGDVMAVILSGLAFALCQRSLFSMPALLFLSLALYGIKQRTNDSLYVSIGLRTGIMFSSFTIKDFGFIIYKSSAPFWLTSTHSWHPFDGIVGLCFCVILALIFYPRQLVHEENTQGNVRE